MLGYEPRYCSFNTKMKVTEIDSLLFGEGTSSEQVTVAVPTGHLIESNDRASVSSSDLEPTKTAATEAGTSSQPRRKAAVPSSLEEGEERMLRRHRQRFVVEDLEALSFGDEALGAPQHVGAALLCRLLWL